MRALRSGEAPTSERSPIADAPRNPWLSHHLERDLPPEDAAVVVEEERVPTLLQRNDSPDLSFRWSANPYRGCSHGCSFCYARPTHEYLGLDAGRDFETRIRAKVNAPEVLALEIGRPSWRGEVIAFSGVTDCYQAAEGRFRLTRGCLEVLREARNPVGIVTRSPLVRRDAELLAMIEARAGARVAISLSSLDAEAVRALEPHAASPAARLQAIAALTEAGVPVTILLAPLIPGFNDHEVAGVLSAARDAGAVEARCILLRLPGNVEDVFTARFAAAFPGRHRKVLSQIRAMRGGRMNDSRFFARHRGEGPRAEAIRTLFAQHRARLGYRDLPPLPPRPRPREEQGELFG